MVLAELAPELGPMILELTSRAPLLQKAVMRTLTLLGIRVDAVLAMQEVFTVGNGVAVLVPPPPPLAVTVQVGHPLFPRLCEVALRKRQSNEHIQGSIYSLTHHARR